MALETMGGVYAVHTKLPTSDLTEGRITSMVCYPTVYTSESVPSENADYLGLVYCKGEHWAVSSVMESLRDHGCTSGRWLFDFYREV